MNWIRYSVGSKRFPQNIGGGSVLASAAVAVGVAPEPEPEPEAPARAQTGGGGSYVPIFIEPKVKGRELEAGAHLRAKTLAFGWPVVVGVAESGTALAAHSEATGQAIHTRVIVGEARLGVERQIGEVEKRVHVFGARITARETFDESEELWLLGIEELGV